MDAVLSEHSHAPVSGEASISLEPIPAVTPSRSEGSILVCSSKQIGTSLVERFLTVVDKYFHE